jgi:DNA-binding transcriptional MerR regulator
VRIGQLATRTNVSIQSLRLYERLGLLTPDGRTTAGYRTFDVDAVRRVRSIRRAQGLGFTLREIAQLLAAPISSSNICQSVHSQASRNLRRLDQRIESLNAMRAQLANYLDGCDKSSSAEACPLYQALNKTDMPTPAPFRKLSGPLIELVFTPDCPSIEVARSAIREALTSQGMQLRWLEWERDHSSTPLRLRSLRSPSVVVNRMDVTCVDIIDQASSKSYPTTGQCGCRCQAPSSEGIIVAMKACQTS